MEKVFIVMKTDFEREEIVVDEVFKTKRKAQNYISAKNKSVNHVKYWMLPMILRD